MKQNTLSIDFKFARISGNVYTFGYDVFRSVTASTEITVQNWSNKAAIPAYYDKVNQRLYAYGVNGYWAVFANSLTFTSVPSDSERIDELTTRVSTLEGNVTSLTTRVGTLEGNVTSLTTRVNSIVSALNSIIIYRSASGNPAIFSNAVADNLKEIDVTMTPTQSGSGQPSISNVRPIIGVSSVTVTRTGTNGANSKSVTVSFVDASGNPLTVYGGTLAVTTGILTVTHKMFNLNTADMNNGEQYPGWQHVPGLPECVPRNQTTPPASTICNILSRSNVAVNTVPENYDVIFFANTGKTQTEWKALALDVQILMPLLTPTVYTLTPAQLAALTGYNSVSTDVGSVSVVYVSSLNLE